ncbi:MAG TPA: class I SAM-dependent methyltransferase [Bryobacteraceae bacterium]|nr:class I SAM-dependent methyltransferase [Bryobacteraceae bacterium]
MEHDPAKRFSSRVADYVRYRPSYPAALVPWLARECGLTAQSVVADIGSGTGFFAALFLRHGCQVFGVEPNPEMRAAGEGLLAAEPRFRSLDGRAESTGLADRAVDFVTAGQAFHWFDRPAAQAEFRRILRPPGWVVLAWNERLVEGPFLEAYEAVLDRYSPEYRQVDHRRMDRGVLEQFFGAGRWKEAAFPNEQRFDLAGLIGRMHSSSYAPAPGSEAYRGVNEELARVFAENQQDGLVAFRYLTKVYCGML